MQHYHFIKQSLITLIALFPGAGTHFVAAKASPDASSQKPNAIIVITDDQGYGDLGFTGNPAIKMPNIDKLRSEGILLNDIHVDPYCVLTRSALMNGRHSNRVGVWHIVHGRIYATPS